MAKTEPRFGMLETKYQFVLNPYPDIRVTRCPSCDMKTGQRKLPLVIHIDPRQLVSLNYTCRFCARCNLLIVHKHEIEHLLTQLFAQHQPELIGNNYLILGTMEKDAWRDSVTNPMPPAEARSHIHDFAANLSELRVTQTGWFPEGKQPPLRPAPASTEWKKPNRLR